VVKGEMLKVLVILEDEYVSPKWLIDEIDLHFDILSKFIKKTYNFDMAFSRNIADYDWIWLLTSGILKAPTNAHQDAFGWMFHSPRFLGYASIQDFKIFDSLWMWMRRRQSWWWELYNGWRTSHEAYHIVLKTMSKPDTNDQYFLQLQNTVGWDGLKIYVDKDANEVGKDGNWEAVFQRPPPL